MTRLIATVAFVLAAAAVVCGSMPTILTAPDANLLRGYKEGEAPSADRDRRATFVFGNTTGYVYPPLSLEREIVGPLRQFVYEGSPAYELLEQNLDPFTVFQPPATSLEFPNIMSARLRRALVALAELVKTVKITDSTGTFDARLTVIRAYRAPVRGLTDPTSTDIRFEGRKAQISIVKAGSLTPLTGQGIFVRLAELAWQAGVDFIATTASWSRLDVSVVPDRCGADLDLAFLLDGSKSLTPAGWRDQMQFVRDISSFFTIHPNRTRVSMTTFHGPLISHISYNASIPNCPVGTIWEPNGQGCVCPLNSLCVNTVDSRNTGCSTGYYENVAGACATANQPNFDITKAPGCELRSFFIHPCTTCTCRPLGQIYTYQDSYTINQLLNQTVDRAALNRTVTNTVYPAGATHMRVGLEVVDSTIFRLGTGMRPSNLGVPRVLIVVTDGKSNPGYEPFDMAKKLKDKGINIFAVGVGEAYEPELDALASNPRYKFLLNSADALHLIADRLSYAQCEIPGVLETGTTIEVNLALDEYRYIQAECNGDTRLVMRDVVAELTTSTGQMSMHLSATNSNPAPLNTIVGAGGEVNPKSLILNRNVGSGLGGIYLGLYGARSANVGSLTVYQQVFVNYVDEVSVLESTNTNTVVTPAPRMNSIPGYTAVWTYRLDRTIGGDGFFSLNSTSGRLTLVRKLDYETRTSFRVKIWAQDVQTACIIGYQMLTIQVADVNDNRPVFTKTTYVASLNEDVKKPLARRAVGDMIVQVEATDADSPAVTSITYKLLTGNERGMFSLNNKTGELFQILPVDFETMGGSVMTLTVVAEDGFGGVSDPATILITVVDVDDPPYFLNVDANGMHPDMQVPQNAPVGIVAGLAIGDDKTINPFSCVMTSGDATLFVAVASSDLKFCNIRSLRSLSGRGGQSFTVGVELRVVGGLVDTARVKLVITASNDYAPAFDKPIYYVIAANTQPVGSTVVAPVITDADGTTTFKCSVAQGAGSQYFGFDDPNKPCVLRVVKPFPTTVLSFSLIISASDGFLSDTSRVEITIFRGCAHTFQCPVGYACAAEITGDYQCTCLDDKDPGVNCNVNYCGLASPSTGNPCSNGATCTNGKSDYTCTGCPANVQGKNCDVVPNLCSPNPCLNGGTCTRVSTIAGSNILNSFKCQCTDAFYGADCSLSDPTQNACASDPCENGGTCVRASSVANGPKDTFVCLCPERTFGPTCVKSREVCDPNAVCNPTVEAGCTGACTNGGLCAPDDQGGICRCTDQFYGAICENQESPSTIDPCSSNPCKYGGTCTRVSSVRNGPKDSFQCTCASGFTGKTCAEFATRCASSANSCLNDGACVPDINGGSCQCVSEPGECYFGTRCERYAPVDCSEASTGGNPSSSSAGSTAAIAGGIAAGVLVLCILVFLVVVHRRRKNNKPTPLPLGSERTSHFDNPTFVSPHAHAFMAAGSGAMPDDGMSNPMYGMGAVSGGSMYGSQSQYDSVAGQQGTYDTVAPLRLNQNLQVDRGNLRLASVSRKNPVAAVDESTTDGDAFGNPMYGANESTYYGGTRQNANINPAYGFQANKSAGHYADAQSGAREGLYSSADAHAERSNGVVGNPAYATSPGSNKTYGDRASNLVGNPTYATSPAAPITGGDRAKGLVGNPVYGTSKPGDSTYDNQANAKGVSPVYDLASSKSATDTGYLDVEMQKNRSDMNDYTTASELRQNLSVRVKPNENTDAYLMIGNQGSNF